MTTKLGLAGINRIEFMQIAPQSMQAIRRLKSS